MATVARAASLWRSRHFAPAERASGHGAAVRAGTGRAGAAGFVQSAYAYRQNIGGKDKP